MSKVSDIEKAYGLLWRDVSSGPIACEARKILHDMIDKDGKRRGIQFATSRHGSVSDKEALEYFP